MRRNAGHFSSDDDEKSNLENKNKKWINSL